MGLLVRLRPPTRGDDELGSPRVACPRSVGVDGVEGGRVGVECPLSVGVEGVDCPRREGVVGVEGVDNPCRVGVVGVEGVDCPRLEGVVGVEGVDRPRRVGVEGEAGEDEVREYIRGLHSVCVENNSSPHTPTHTHTHTHIQYTRHIHTDTRYLLSDNLLQVSACQVEV